MVQFNTNTNEILLKIVYYGPGLSGKTANLYALHAMCMEDLQGEFFSVNTQEDRTLFFDLLPISLGTVFGSSIHIQVYTVPGQPQYDATRRVVLDGTDGVVFVADSSESKIQENIDSLTNMHHNLNVNMIDIKQIPFVIQYNKRDLPDAMPVGLMNRKLNFRSVPFFETVAITGTGILETFIAIAKETVMVTFKKHNLDKKIPNFTALLEAVETSLRASMNKKSTAMVEPIKEKNTVVRLENTSIDDLPKNRQMDPTDLLSDALTSSMETAKLYSDTKMAKEELELRHANLERLIQSIRSPIVSFDLDGLVLTCNKAAESIFGLPRTEILNRNISQFTPPDKQSDIAQAIHDLLKGLPVQDIPCAYKNLGGADIQLKMALAPIVDENNNIVAFSVLLK